MRAVREGLIFNLRKYVFCSIFYLITSHEILKFSAEFELYLINHVSKNRVVIII